jgi:L-ascorbate metabolism protein UlaG (beta-lactamase superfamily)
MSSLGCAGPTIAQLFLPLMTLSAYCGGQRMLIDPMLDEAGARPAVENTENVRRNPLVPLPLPVEEIVAGLDAILVTHLHRDHFDDGAVRHLPRDVPLYAAYAPSASRRFPFMTGSTTAT